MTRPSTRGALLAVFVLTALAASKARADQADDALAVTLIDRFYEALAPDNDALAAYMGDGFQIIGSDGLRFDRESYLAFPKQVTEYEIGGLVVRRDGDLLTATFDVTYTGTFQGVARVAPKLARLAVFRETGGDWKIEALAALGTGENDVSGVAPGVLATWLAATASGDRERIAGLAAPDFQLQQADGKGLSLDAYLAAAAPSAGPAPAAEDIVATSFSNTMIVRYTLRAGEGAEAERTPRLTVFQRLNGAWKAAADAVFAPRG